MKIYDDLEWAELKVLEIIQELHDEEKGGAGRCNCIKCWLSRSPFNPQRISMKTLIVSTMLLVATSTVYAEDLRLTERETRMQPNSMVIANQHPTERWITVVSGQVTFSDERGVFKLSAGNMHYIPAMMPHTLLVGSDGVVLHHVGYAPQDEPLHSCGM